MVAENDHLKRMIMIRLGYVPTRKILAAVCLRFPIRSSYNYLYETKQSSSVTTEFVASGQVGRMNTLCEFCKLLNPNPT